MKIYRHTLNHLRKVIFLNISITLYIKRSIFSVGTFFNRWSSKINHQGTSEDYLTFQMITQMDHSIVLCKNLGY